jgi:hypothetical protein
MLPPIQGALFRENVMRNLILGLVLFPTPALAQEAQQAAPPPAEPVPQAVTQAPTNPPMTGPKILIST